MSIKDAVESYLSYKNSLGYKYNNVSFMLKMFVSFVGQDRNLDDITTDECSAFMRSKCSNRVTHYWECLHSTINGLFKWAKARGYAYRNPVQQELPVMEEHIKAYILIHEELKAIFDNVVWKDNMTAQYPEVVSATLRMMYMLGLRPGEPLKLKLEDINLSERFVVIHDTKFHKSRVVPFNDTFAKMLSQYLSWRVVKKLPSGDDDYVFLNRHHQPISVGALSQIFKKICRLAGIERDDHYRFGIRLYDLRHTFATERICNWYKKGDDIQILLPTLSTYLGHQHISDTSVYISMTDDLLTEASRKFESFVTKKIK